MKKSTNLIAPIQERRYGSGELRVKSDGSDNRTIFGYAALFSPAQTQDMGGWREEIHPNAFDRCLRGSPDVVALFNHDSNALPLARTTSGTLRISVDQRGLKYELDAPQTTLAKDLMTLMDRGDIHQSSYGFICRSESWRSDSDGTPIRTILDADLLDVSPVIFPATLDTTSGVRAVALRNAPRSVREKLDVRDEASDDEPCDEEDEDCEVCDEDSDQYDEEQCETYSLRRRLRAAEKRIAIESEQETVRLRQRLQAARVKIV